MTTIPRFGSVALHGDGVPNDAKRQFDDHFHQVGHSAGWQTPEHILVPPLFGDGDLRRCSVTVTSRAWTSWPPGRALPPICAARTRRCT